MVVALATANFATSTTSPQAVSDETQKLLHLFGTVVIDANPATYAPGGLVCTFAGFDLVKSAYVPIEVRAWSEPTSGTPSGYDYQYVRGTLLSNGKLIVLQCGGAAAPSAEIPTAAIPAAVSGDTIRFHAIFARL
jgi:hypothetical protein